MNSVSPETEIWKPVVGFEMIYDVSNQGNVRRSYTAPECRSTKRGRSLKPDDHDGYRRVSLLRSGKTYRMMVHRMVAMAFLEGYVPGRQINHRNGVKHDNRSENLEWVSQRENILHAWRTGLSAAPQGEDHGASVLDEKSVKAILVLLANGVEGQLIAKAYGVTGAAISSIKRGQSWLCVSKTNGITNE